MDRREFGQHTLGSLLTFSLLETILPSEALADAVRPIAARWLEQVNQMSKDLKGQKLKQTEWQTQVEDLFAQVDLSEFLTYVDFAKLTKDMKFQELGERSFRAEFPKVEGLPTELVYGHQMFALQKDRSVVPHGHENMATAFLVLEGEFAGKHYDRLENHKKHMIIRPTIDRKFTPGEYSTVSDHKDNVHWFKTLSKTGYIFNIHVLNVDPDVKKSGRVYIDPHGEPLSGGRIKADKLRAVDAFKRYG